MNNLLWYLLGATRGGGARAIILNSLHQKPQNTNQLSITLHLDYKTIQHHLKILEKHRLLTSLNKDQYGAVYFIDKELEKSWSDFEQIWKQCGTK